MSWKFFERGNICHSMLNAGKIRAGNYDSMLPIKKYFFFLPLMAAFPCSYFLVTFSVEFLISTFFFSIHKCKVVFCVLYVHSQLLVTRTWLLHYHTWPVRVSIELLLVWLNTLQKSWISWISTLNNMAKLWHTHPHRFLSTSKCQSCIHVVNPS